MNQSKRPTSGAGGYEQKQLKSLKQQNELLSQFLVRLTNFYDGAFPELDQELQTLRGHLSGNPNYTFAAVSIKKLTSMLMQSSQNFRKHTTDTLSILESAIKKLQGDDSVSEDIRVEATRFLNKLSGNMQSAFSSTPQFESVLALYQRALKNLRSAPATKPVTTTSKASDDEQEVTEAAPIDKMSRAGNAKLHAQISAELQALVEQFFQANKQDKQLQQIRQRILDGISQTELLECCLLLLRIIVRDLIEEAELADKFVREMHQSLISMQTTVGDSVKSTKAAFEAKQENTQVIRAQLSDFGDMVTDSDDLQKLKEQANDYLAKLSSTLNAQEKADQKEELKVVKLLSEMQSQLTRLEKQTNTYRKKLIDQRIETHTDPLTKVANRIAYDERMETEYARHKRTGSPLCVAIVDVDRFKSINDKYGHAAGDKTLKILAKHIGDCLRSTDFLARWGGEEFVMLFPDTKLEDLHKPLETIRKKLEKLPFKFKQEKVTITASFGATCFNSGETVEDVFERADKNLYQAKNSGRNLVIISKD
ncbi:GGDEF domain-containing protein [Aestuariibacter salexigens]|uniref:GGDEF domain-containing protein n=1 Tax=Aestuariibacter salexigens TaxID=226010 RepID=UPI000417DDE8|nr:GGDEF domain-containing protein [Aestuariibacter salexigens]